MAKSNPVLTGAGSFQGSYECFAADSPTSLTSFPTAPVVVGGIRLVTVQSDDAVLPAFALADDDGSVFVAVAGLGLALKGAKVGLQVGQSPQANVAGQKQFTVAAIAPRAAGGNRVVATWSGTPPVNPRIFVQDFNPLGS